MVLFSATARRDPHTQNSNADILVIIYIMQSVLKNVAAAAEWCRGDNLSVDSRHLAAVGGLG